MKTLIAVIALMLLTAAAAAAATPTFNKDIAPILYQNCAVCHRPNEVAPFSLLTYQDAAKRAKLIATVTERRYMPPWKAEPGYGHFANERRLTRRTDPVNQRMDRRGSARRRYRQTRSTHVHQRVAWRKTGSGSDGAGQVYVVCGWSGSVPMFRPAAGTRPRCPT